MKKTIALAAVLLLFAVALCGCTQTNTQAKIGSGLMAFDTNTNLNNNTNADKNSQTYNNLDQHIKVKEGDHIAVNYTGRLLDGNVFDTSIGRSPLEFTVGAGEMIKGFDAAVVGMEVGQTKSVSIPPQDAYGEYDANKTTTIDANAFADFSSLKLGMVVSASNGMRGTITQKNDKNAIVDFNPDLAGKTLVFEITIVSIN